MSRCVLFEPVKKPLAGHETINQFGNPVYLFDESTQRRPYMFDGEKVCDAISKRLKELDFDPETDFIVICGSLNAVVNMISVACNQYGQIQALMHVYAKNEYVKTQLG